MEPLNKLGKLPPDPIKQFARNKKKLTKKQKEQQIEANHRKSGYHKQTVKTVSGGLPSLGKKRDNTK